MVAFVRAWMLHAAQSVRLVVRLVVRLASVSLFLGATVGYSGVLGYGLDAFARAGRHGGVSAAVWGERLADDGMEASLLPSPPTPPPRRDKAAGGTPPPPSTRNVTFGALCPAVCAPL